MEDKNVERETDKSLAELQLSEIEMLKSMFPKSNEFSIDECHIQNLKTCIDGSPSSNTLGQLEYSINLEREKGIICLHVAAPRTYPLESPRIYIRSNALTRDAQKKINEELSGFLESFNNGELLVGVAVSWLQDNIENFLSNSAMPCENDTQRQSTGISDDLDEKFRRLWIYSHHIYSKTKRKDIKELANEYQLTGFCLPGKPGLICVEGLSRNVNAWWHIVRSWNWQKIICKRQEDELMSDSLKKLSRFEVFQELGSETNIRIKSNGFHVDMGDLYRYLKEHGCGYMFEEIFNVQGK